MKSKKFFSAMSVLTVALATLLLSLPVRADAAKGDWVFRTRAIYIAPDDSYDGPLDLKVKDDVAFDIDLSYFVTRNIALELTALVSSHEVKDKDLGSLGSVRVLPPVLTLQYHFLPDGKFRPYVGAGINYTVFYDETGTLDNLGAELDNAFGWAGQAGMDIMLNETLSLNLDIKYVDLNTDIDSDGGDLGDVDINPWIFGIGLGYRF